MCRVDAGTKTLPDRPTARKQKAPHSDTTAPPQQQPQPPRTTKPPNHIRLEGFSRMRRTGRDRRDFHAPQEHEQERGRRDGAALPGTALVAQWVLGVKRAQP